MSLAVEAARPVGGPGRAKAIAVLVGVTVLVLGSVAAAWWWAYGTAADLNASWARLQTLRQVGGNSQGPAGAGNGALLLSGGSSGAATAELQRIVGAMARTYGASMRSTQAAAPREQGEIIEVGLGASLLADTTQLRDLLHAIESGMPLMIVDELSVRAIPSAAAAPAQPMQLEVEIKLRAFAAGSSGGRKEAAP